MKKIIIAFFVLFNSFSAFSQAFKLDVFRTSARAIDKTRLSQAARLIDINPKYPSSWINFYNSVELSVTANGVVRKATSKDDKLTTEQAELLKKADAFSNVNVVVTYNPKNSLNDLKDVRVLDFSMTVLPHKEAEFVGGQDKLMQYLKSKIVDNLTLTAAELTQYADLTFVIDEEGVAKDIKWTQSSNNAELDKLVYDTIGNMPKWIPSQNTDGTKYKQTFRFALGNSDQSCYLGVY